MGAVDDDVLVHRKLASCPDAGATVSEGRKGAVSLSRCGGAARRGTVGVARALESVAARGQA